MLEIILWIVVAYLVLGFATALMLSQTPYSENGFIKNMLCAGLYWIAAFRGQF